MRVPDKLFVEPFNLRSLQMDGFTVIESCAHQKFSNGEMLVGQHLLLFVLKGKYIAYYGKEKYQVEQGEGLIIQRTHFIEYEKYSSDNDQYVSLMFFLNDGVIKDFLAFNKSEKRGRGKEKLKSVLKINLNLSIQIFLQSILTSFDNSLANNSAFLKHKLFELLFNLSNINSTIINLFTQFTTHQIMDIRIVMETNYRKNLTLEDYAYKAGRSLASFKRDFKKVYNTSPHQWILSRRLEFSKQLIENSKIKISDACYDAGFESIAHFSRAFKSKFGYPPSYLHKN